MVLATSAALLAALPLALQAAAPDALRTVEGEVFTGRIVFEDEELVVLRDGSRLRELDRAELESVESVRESLRLLLIYLRDAPVRSFNAAVEQALFAGNRGLAGEERLLWLRALLMRTDDEEVHRALGNRPRGSRWEIEHEGRWWTLDDLVRRTREWRHAWELETLHFELRTNLELPDAIGLAFDLEHFYFTFYELLQPHLGFHEVTEQLRVHAYADTASFPEMGAERISYFSPAENTVFLNCAGRLNRGIALHEATHLLLHNTLLVSLTGMADLPEWVDEGLAEYMRAACYGPLGRLETELGRKNDELFAEHARSDRTYDVGRVLNFAKGDFLARSTSELKYAQSYTLVDFLLHGEEGAYRARFFDFLRWCLEGRSSPTHFWTKMGMTERELQRAWTRYVEGRADAG